MEDHALTKGKRRKKQLNGLLKQVLHSVDPNSLTPSGHLVVPGVTKFVGFDADKQTAVDRFEIRLPFKNGTSADLVNMTTKAVENMTETFQKVLKAKDTLVLKHTVGTKVMPDKILIK